MTVITVKAFRDKKEGVSRKPGDTFSVSEERFKEINSTRFGILVAEETNKSKKKSKK